MQPFSYAFSKNPPEYNRSVRDFDVVTLDRVKRIDVREDFAVWKEYARGLRTMAINQAKDASSCD